MSDPFAIDAQRRQALMDRVYAVRGALAAALEQQDGEAALKALAEAYKLVDLIPDAQLLYVSGGDSASFVLPESKQITAKFGGPCSVCGGRIRPGEIMYWEGSTKRGICARCSVGEFFGGR